MRTLAAIVLLAVALGGCGSDNSAQEATDYAQAVQQAQSTFSSSFEAAIGRLEGTSEPRLDALALQDAAKAVNADVTALNQVVPPKPVIALHAKLVAVLTAYRRDVLKAASTIGKGEPRAFERARDKLITSSTMTRDNFNAIVRQINNQLS